MNATSETAIISSSQTPNSNVIGGAKPSFSFLSKSPMQFLIMDTPRSANLHLYIRECRRYNVTDIVRVCEEKTYCGSNLTGAGITLHEMPYPDGHSPPDEVLDRWLQLVDDRFIHPTPSSSVSNGDNNGSTHSSLGVSLSHPDLTGPTIAIHCVAGLGRAPVLVAIALIEFAKMEPVDAATFIRKHRRGSINNTQLDWLENYKRRRKTQTCCVVM